MPIQKIQKIIARGLMGAVPKLPLDWGETQVQGPLTQKPFNDHFYNEIEGYISNKRILKKTMDGPTRPFQTPGFSLEDWKSEDVKIEDFLKNYRKNEFGVALLGNLQIDAFLDLKNGQEPENFEIEGGIGINDFISKTKSKDYNGHMLKWGGKKVRESLDCLKASIDNRQYGWPICAMSEEIQNNPKAVRMVLENDPTDICYINAKMLDNLDAMEPVVRHKIYANCIKYSSARVKNNPRMALIGLYYKEGVKTKLGCFGDKIRDNDLFFLMAYNNDSQEAWRFTSDRLRNKYFFLRPVW